MYKYILFAFAAIIMTACEKEIDINYHTINPILVVECSLNQNGTIEAQLFTTVNMDASEAVAPYSKDAVITVHAPSGEQTTLQKNGNKYQASFDGKSGEEYTLTVNIGGVTYTSRSVMPSMFSVESLGFSAEIPQMSTKLRYKYKLRINTIPSGDARQYFIVRLYRNGRHYSWTMTDSRNAGKDGSIDINVNLFSQSTDSNDSSRLNDGDEITAVVSSVSERVYTYFYSIKSSSASNSNPLLLFESDRKNSFLLGYFSAQTEVTTKPSKFIYSDFE